MRLGLAAAAVLLDAGISVPAFGAGNSDEVGTADPAYDTGSSDEAGAADPAYSVGSSDEAGTAASAYGAGSSDEAGAAVPVFGVGGSDEARDAVAAGSLTGTVGRDEEELADAIAIISGNFITGAGLLEGISEEMTEDARHVSIPCKPICAG